MTGATGQDKLAVTVIGLGYVGLPLAVALARHFTVTGYDVNEARIAGIARGHDHTGEIDDAVLEASALRVTSNPADCMAGDFYIVTVPTPVDGEMRPDLSLVEEASRTVGAMLRRAPELKVTPGRQAPVVVYESTVYPGVTEEVCVPILESSSGLTCGRDFFVGYSPERINPGDREHTIDRITKVVAGQTPEVLDSVAALYGAITGGGVFRAASIRVAEAAKVIENAQRDINIAFMNEIAQIFAKMGISVWDVLEAARTKWNFLPFTPGLVGGHCIGVDPYYLSHRAQALGHEPQVLLAGRGVNDTMAHYVAASLHRAREGRAGSVLVLGLTFKENVPDLRNSKVSDLVGALDREGHSVTLHDPVADPAEAERAFCRRPSHEALGEVYDLVLLAVPHKAYLDMGSTAIRALVAPGGTLADLKGVLGSEADWRL